MYRGTKTLVIRKAANGETPIKISCISHRGCYNIQVCVNTSVCVAMAHARMSTKFSQRGRRNLHLQLTTSRTQGGMSRGKKSRKTR